MTEPAKIQNATVRTMNSALRYDWDTPYFNQWTKTWELSHHTFIGPNPPEEVLDALSREQARRGEVHEGIKDGD